MTASCKETIVVLKKELNLCELILTTSKEKWVAIEKVVKDAKQRVVAAEASAQDPTAQAIADFKESQDFAEAIVEGLTKAYQFSFEDCKARVAQLYPKVNLSKVSATKEAKEEPTSATTKPNAITKANAKLPLLLLSFRL